MSITRQAILFMSHFYLPTQTVDNFVHKSFQNALTQCRESVLSNRLKFLQQIK